MPGIVELSPLLGEPADELHQVDDDVHEEAEHGRDSLGVALNNLEQFLEGVSEFSDLRSEHRTHVLRQSVECGTRTLNGRTPRLESVKDSSLESLEGRLSGLEKVPERRGESVVGGTNVAGELHQYVLHRGRHLAEVGNDVILHGTEGTANFLGLRLGEDTQRPETTGEPEGQGTGESRTHRGEENSDRSEDGDQTTHGEVQLSPHTLTEAPPEAHTVLVGFPPETFTELTTTLLTGVPQTEALEEPATEGITCSRSATQGVAERGEETATTGSTEHAEAVGGVVTESVDNGADVLGTVGGEVVSDTRREVTAGLLTQGGEVTGGTPEGFGDTVGSSDEGATEVRGEPVTHVATLLIEGARKRPATIGNGLLETLGVSGTGSPTGVTPTLLLVSGKPHPSSGSLTGVGGEVPGESVTGSPTGVSGLLRGPLIETLPTQIFGQILVDALAKSLGEVLPGFVTGFLGTLLKVFLYLLPRHLLLKTLLELLTKGVREPPAGLSASLFRSLPQPVLVVIDFDLNVTCCNLETRYWTHLLKETGYL